jgi:hypothetical protein
MPAGRVATLRERERKPLTTVTNHGNLITEARRFGELFENCGFYSLREGKVVKFTDWGGVIYFFALRDSRSFGEKP